MSVVSKEYHYYLRLIALRKELFFIISLLGMTAAIVVCYLLPKKFDAKTTILIEQNVITDLVKGIAVSPSIQAKIKNLTVTLTSRNLLLKVLKELDKDLTFASPSDEEAYIKSLQQRIVVNLNEKQGVFTISLRDDDPAFARDFVNTMTRIYIEQNTTTKREESLEATSFLADQIQVFKKRVDAADEAINKLKSDKGLILSTDDSYIRSEIGAAEKKLEELSIRRAELTGKLALLGSGKGGGHKSAGDPQAELNRLLTIYTEKHPKVIRARQALLASRGGKQGAAEGVSEASRPAKLIQLEIESLKALEARQTKIIEDNRELVRNIPQLKASLAELVAQKEHEAAVYNKLVERYGQSEISKQMELQDKSTMFRVIDPAVMPEAPASPNRPAIILVGIFLSICLGAATVYLAEHFNRSVKSIQEIKTLALPIFAVIPRMISMDEALRGKKRDRVVLALAGSYFSLILAVLLVESFRTFGVVAALRQAAHNIL